MKLPGEDDAIQTVRNLGSVYGYGNLIERLKEAWREILPTETCPADSNPVDLTIDEAKALRAAVMGDRIDSKALNSAISRIDRALDRCST